MLTVLGLTLDIVGAVLVGVVVPRYQGVAYGGPIVTEPPGRRFWTLGWAMLSIGFLLQLLGAFLHW